ncbi:MAG: DUF6427 family protein [Draconibacterium sp.]|nr:DUF6427 family protein [Draconibacterium sp.]
MLLRTLKSNNSANLLIFPFIALAFWLKDLLAPYSYSYVQAENHNVLFAPIFRLIENHPFWHVFISFLFVVVLGFIIQLINDRYLFIRIRTKLPAALFVIILAGFTKMHTLHPVYFATFFLLFAISRLFGIFEKSKPYSAVFDVGFLIGIGSLFYFNMVILIPAFLFGIMIIKRETRWREYVILLLGFILPFLFAAAYFFVVGRLEESLELFSSNLITPVNHFRTNYPLHGYLTLLILFTITGSFSILRQYDSKKVSSRKYFSVFFLIFVFSLISFAFIPATSQEMLIILAVPVTYLISNLLVFMRSRFWSELMFSLLLGIVIVMQFLL